MVGLEADQDVGIADADGAGIVIGHVDAADGQPDIADDAVELAGGNNALDRRSDPVGESSRLFDARSRRCADVQLDLAAVDGWEEILAEVGYEPKRQQAEAQEPGSHLDPVAQAELHQTQIGAADRVRNNAQIRGASAAADCGSVLPGRDRRCRSNAGPADFAAGNSPSVGTKVRDST